MQWPKAHAKLRAIAALMVLLVLLVIVGGAKLLDSEQRALIFFAQESIANDPEFSQPIAALTVCNEGPPVCQFSRIQEAIDVAPSYSHILIQSGNYRERLTVSKSLTLHGAGPGVIIQPSEEEPPGAVIVIGSPGEKPGNLQVALTHLTIQLGPLSTSTLSIVDYLRAGIFIRQQAGAVTLQQIEIRGTTGPLGMGTGVGVHVRTGNMLQILRSRIQAVGYGIVSWESNALTLMGVRVENVITGIDVSGGVTFIDDTQISQAHLYGLSANDGYVFLNRSRFKGALGQGAYGIYGSRLRVLLASETRIEGFEMAGVVGKDIEQLFLRGVMVIQNGFGVVLRGSTRLMMENSRVAKNREWGIAHEITGCYGEAPMVILGMEVLGSNNEIPDRDEPAGNQKGALCPADYPWPPGFRK